MALSTADLLKRRTRNRVEDRAYGIGFDRIRAAGKAVVDKEGLVAGEHPLDRGERLLAFLDFTESGALDSLAARWPKHHRAMLRQFRRDAQAEGLLE